MESKAHCSLKKVDWWKKFFTYKNNSKGYPLFAKI